MLTNIKNMITELANKTPAKQREEKRRNLYESYKETGATVRDLIKDIRKLADTLKRRYGVQLAMHDEVFKKVADIENFINVSDYTAEDFAANVTDENSVWVTGRIKKIAEMSALIKKYSLAGAKVEERGKQKKQVLSWPVDLAVDLQKLDAWITSVQEAINSMKDAADERELSDLRQAERELGDMRKQMTSWSEAARLLGAEAKDKEITEADESFTELVRRADAQRAAVREGIKNRDKTLTRLSKVRKRHEAKVGLKKDTLVMTRLVEKLNTLVLSKRIYAHSKWKCRQALAEAAAMKLTGDPVRDYQNMRSVISTMSSAASSVAYY